MFNCKSEKELKHLKLTIKNWESEFARSNLRKPQKEDIQSASSEIKEAYKSYWALKNKLELEKFNKDDVWSENLNKSYKGNIKIQTSDGIFKKYCNKIRERSCVINQVNTEKFSCKESRKKPGSLVKVDSDDYNQNASNTANCDNSNFSNLEVEIEVVKPVRKIMKLNNVSKKLKSVNVLSPSITVKGLGKKLSFETDVNSEWLERCYSNIVNNSYDCEDKISVSNKKIPMLDTDEHVDAELEPYNKMKCSPLKISETEPNNAKRVNYSGILSQNFTSFEERTLKDEMPAQYSIVNEENHLKSNIFSNMKESKLQSPNKNETYCTFEDVMTTKKTKSSDSLQYSTSSCTIDERECIKYDSFSEIKSKLQSPMKDETLTVVEVDSKTRKRKLSKTVNSKSSNHLERKMASGTLNENYVKVNIKKKKFSRGHRSVNIKKLKWKKWKELKKIGSDGNISSPSSCFKCGQVGHWARNCKAFTKSSTESENNMEDFDEIPLPTLEEAADLAKKSNVLQARFSGLSNNMESSSNSASVNDIMRGVDFNDLDSTHTKIKPLYTPSLDGKMIETPEDVLNSLKELGYSEFRKGQERAIMRILCGLSTLVVLPTGSGKSLCYQLPAYIYAKKFKCITIVISPLVSLMEDQVTGLPACLHAICLHSGMTEVKKKASLQDLSDGKAQILLVSPEAVIGGLAYGSGMLPINMPPIAFACIDEVHCLSQWSHNFRPSYLQLYKVLTERFNVKCILGLTATANQSTAKEIVSHLGLKSIEESVIGSTGIPDNLHLSASRDKDKDKALIHLLTGDRFNKCSSIIIYCIRRDETERLATLIRTLLQDQTSDEPLAKKRKLKSKKRNFVWTAEAYHAGLAPPRRRSIQKLFMTGKLRVVVATIAFGMGLDKRDVRAIIHYNMPKSFESYVQEIGRAGRDGLDSHCHLFLDNEGKDIQELQRFIYSNSTDRYIIRKLLKKVFIPCQCKSSVAEHCSFTDDKDVENEFQFQTCSKHEIAFSITEAVQELDFREENILTLLCYLELHPKKWIEVLPLTYSTCSIRCYGGSKQLRALALKSPPVAAAFALDAKRNKNLDNISSYDFDVVQVASIMGWNTSSVKRSLKNLEWNDQKRKTGVIVEFSNLSLHIRSPGNLSDDELDEVLDYLHQKVVTCEKKELLNLKYLHSIFSKYSHNHYWACSEEAPVTFSESIKEAVNKYFDETANLENAEDLVLQLNVEDNVNVDIVDVRSQIKDIIFTNNDQNFTGRAIARIFHGIGSPCFPSEVWGRVRKFWRSLLHVNFNLLIKLANEELKKAK